MEFNKTIERIDSFLKSSSPNPRIVNFNNREQMNDFIKHYDMSKLKIIDVCKEDKDKYIQLSDIYYELSQANENVMLIHATSQLLLEGKEVLSNFIKNIISKSFPGFHVIIVTYQCEKELNSIDPRYRNFVYKVTGEEDRRNPKIFFSSNKKCLGNPCVNGINSIGRHVEDAELDELYCFTKFKKDDFPYSTYTIADLNDTFDLVARMDTNVTELSKDFGTSEQWEYAFDQLRLYDTWENLIYNKFHVNAIGLSTLVGNFENYNDNDQWLFFVGLKLFGSDRAYLRKVLHHAKNIDEFKDGIFNIILDSEPADADFIDLYHERKELIRHLGNEQARMEKFCKLVSQKEEKLIYYLTDLYPTENQKLIEYLSRYHNAFKPEKLFDLVCMINGTLKSYLDQFNLGSSMLNKYFDQYKRQKLCNYISDDFQENVLKEARERNFNKIQPRSSIVSNLDDIEDSDIYFIDALGVEYLGYISNVCNELGMRSHVSIGVSNLPTLTSFNKDFVDILKNKGANFVPNENGFKELDNIKHEGANNISFEKNELPTHIFEELSVIKNILIKINTQLKNTSSNKAIIVSDHGASRLAVINKHENKWEMSSRGEHAGRCCPVSDFDECPEYATEENDYWVLANYDRFKGSRKANVEVHGGATLEEVLVPVIEISLGERHIEIIVESKTVKFTPMKKPVLKLFTSEKTKDLSILFENEFYNAETSDNQNFEITLPKIRKKGEYKFNVYIGGNLIEKDLSFKAVNKAMQEKDLF